MSRWLALLLLVVAFGERGKAAEPAVTERLVLISIDGLRPEFYLPGSAWATNCPQLVKLRAAGSYAKAAIAVDPSMTYPGHASIATGVNPARHGVAGNNVFVPGEEGRGFWFASDLRVPALWDVAKQAGLTVGTVSWPVTGGAKTIDWNLAEFWTTAAGSQEAMTRKYSTPGLVRDLPRSGDPRAWDEYVAGRAVELLTQQRPNLLLVHLVEPDKVQHRGGREASELPAAMQRVDELVGRIVTAAGETATVLVVGDHGFSTVSQSVAPNILLARDGFITVVGGKVTEWRAFVENTGGSATVHVKDAVDRAAVLELLRRESGELYEVVAADVIRLEARPGYMFSGTVKGDRLVRGSSIKGNHGYRATLPEMHTGFIAAGRGIKPGVVLEQVHLVDVAPTAARLLGTKMADVDGRVVKEIVAD